MSFEEVWAIVQEASQIVKETSLQMKETDRKFQETSQGLQETSQGLQETRQGLRETRRIVEETARQMKETDKKVGELTNRFGEMVEYMVVPNLVAKFRELGFTFTKANRDTEIKDREHNIIAEVDAFLENGDSVMIVETKTKPVLGDINAHLKRMEKLRRYADLHNDKRKYYGAVAGVVFGESVKVYTLKRGFFAVEPSGDTFNIIKPEGEYRLRVW
jgi:chromosome segregation ATPase